MADPFPRVLAHDVETAANQAASCGHALTETRVLDSTLQNLRYAARTLARLFP